ncbi:phage minor head protein [Azorhizobium caulinodans]|uniref:phage head morphogenesis protein n=1 Tax=Azorhizobium caulinodans TaxID=7 RepID=UPI002FBD71F1
MTTTISAVAMPFDEAVAYLGSKTNVTSKDYTDVWGKANVKSFTVAGAATEALVSDFRAEVAKALEKGTSLQEFRKSFESLVAKHGWDHTGKPGWRARIIYETNLGMAYSAGRYAQQTEAETLAAFPYWEYVHSGALHPRRQHLAWNGLTLRADDPFWQTHYPPNGWRCGCRTRPVSARGLQRMGKSGPDTAPPIRLKTYTNRKTGEVFEVPEGIDPGFDYNVGQEWTGKAPQIPANATLRAPAAAPARGRAPSTEVEDFTRRVLSGEINDRASSVVAGELPDDIASLVRGPEGASSRVELSAFRVLKVAGRAEEMGGKASTPHPEVTAREWARLQEMFERGEVWRDTGAHVFGDRQITIFHELEPDRPFVTVVRQVATPDGKGRLIIPTFHEVGARRKARMVKRMMKVERN